VAGAEQGERRRHRQAGRGPAEARSYVEVDSIDDILARAEELGGKVVTAKSPISETSWWAVFQDSEGNELGLYEGTTAGVDQP
jgi:predicted enzyme related to lactoylglutathione lyase